MEKFKARFVAQGFSQVEGVVYEETFAPDSCYTSTRAVISIAAEMGWKIHQMDVKNSFLNGVIQEEVYIEQPEGFELHGRESHVCRLKKALYGLKQAPRAWYERIDAYLQKLGFQKSDANPNLYFILVGDNPLIMVLYVNDLFVIGDNNLTHHCKRDLASKFDTIDMGLMHYFLGPMATHMITNWKKLHDVDSELVDPTLYHQLIDSLMYLVNIRPDICFAINILSQFMLKPRRVHWVPAKHLLRSELQGSTTPPSNPLPIRAPGGSGARARSR
eukprot:PITA_01704